MGRPNGSEGSPSGEPSYRDPSESNIPVPTRATDRRKKLIIWGAGGHARVVASIAKAIGHWEVVGFLEDTSSPPVRDHLPSVPMIGGREKLGALLESGITHMAVAIGDCAARLEIAELASAKGFEFPILIHPSAVIAPESKLGNGTVVVAGAIINPGASIGRQVIINTGATVDHDCLVEDGVHICPGVHLGGGVRIGRRSWIGIGATVIHNITIGRNVYVGGGAVVVRDIPDNVVAYGVPARIVRRIS